MEKTKCDRNYGIDSLRITAMLGVVLLHILYHGTILDNASGGTYAAVWLLEIICLSAVNCYAAISGFVMYSDDEKTFSRIKYIKLWACVFFWSFFITLFFFFYGGTDVGIKDLIKSALPVGMGTYWYFSAYTLLFFMIPYLNKLMRAVTRLEATRLMITLFFIISVVGIFNDPFGANYGYSFLWLAFMYIVGAWMKKCGIAEKIRTGYAVLAIVFCVLISYGFFMMSPFKNDMLIKYISPTMVCISVSEIIVFSKLKIEGVLKRIIAFLSPASFGVYIIHQHPLIKCRFEEWFGFISRFSTIAAIGAVILCALIVFSVCLLAEKARMILFEALKVNVKAEKMCRKTVGKIEQLLTKYE